MNILVTGANGQLGNCLRDRAAKYPGRRFIFTDVTRSPEVETVYLDITDADAVRLICQSEKVDLIVNCAAYTAVDKAEEDTALCALLNARAPGILAAAAAACGAGIIHISTDYVFGGDVPVPLKEDFPVHPTGVYGATKLQGEKAVTDAGCPSWIIIRTAWLYSTYGKNFVKTMKELTASRPQVKVVFDQVGTPTYAGDLADLILHIIGTSQWNKSGIYHFSDEGVCSWFDFATAIRDLSGGTARVQPCHSDEFPSKVHRPAFSVLDKSKVKEVFGFEVPHWYESLKKCLSL